MNNRMKYIHDSLPSYIFNRCPNSINRVTYWKATEYRLFLFYMDILLYTGHIILKDLIPD